MSDVSIQQIFDAVTLNLVFQVVTIGCQFITIFLLIYLMWR